MPLFAPVSSASVLAALAGQAISAASLTLTGQATIGSFASAQTNQINVRASSSNDTALLLKEAAEEFGFTVRNKASVGLQFVRHSGDATGETVMTIRRDAALVCLGTGITSSFPALKRNGVIIQSRLGDDSAFGSFQGKLQTDNAYAVGVVVPTGTITLYDSTGTAYRVGCAL